MLLAALLFAFPDRSPDDTAKSLHGPPGFEFTVFAAEPMVVNPTNMEVDSRGRVWVTEGLNYRFFANKEFKRVPGADKIKILEDTNGDGRADKVTVFAENIYPVPMGLAIQEIWKDGKYAGCRVFTGNSPDLLVFEDTNGDDKADKREVLLTGFGGHDSDHGVHGMFLGPDGLLYFTQGDGRYGGGGGPKLPPNCTMKVTGKDGRTVENYKDGTVLRCNLDGTGLELLATGLRNNYEVCVDSYGRIFASDNDDDGNRGCRMCWILPGAHYGYKTPGSSRHWAEENPANTPKLVGTGNGSPCGIMVYEGELLPPEVRGAVLQVDAGTRQINLHPLTKVGASLRTEYKVLVQGDDPQFRPVDCCTAPDGSLMIADWYDAGVGGHRFTDQKTGRVYRLAPKGMKYERPKVDLGTSKGVVAAIGSPNVTTSFAAAQDLKGRNENSLMMFLVELKPGGPDTVTARITQALWQTTFLEGKAKGQLPANVPSWAVDLVLRLCQRKTAIPGGRPNINSLMETAEKLPYLAHPSMYSGACLEALLFLRDLKSVIALVRAWDGSDRFYLQAIRIGCQNLSYDAKKELFDALLDDALKFKAANDNFALPPYYPTGSNEAFPLPSDPVPPPDARGKLIGVAWVLESIEALPALERLMSERPSDAVNRGVMMALSRFRDPKAADAIFAQLAKKGDSFHRSAMLQLLGDRLKKDWKSLLEDRRIAEVYKSSIDDSELRLAALRTLPEKLLRGKDGLRDKIVGFVTDVKQDMAVREAAFTMLIAARDPEASTLFDAELKTSLGATAAPPLALIGVSAMLSRGVEFSADTSKLLLLIRETKYPVELRRRAVKTMATHANSARDLLRVHKIKPLPEDVHSDLRYLLSSHADGGVRNEAAKLFPPVAGRSLDVRKLLTMECDVERGRTVFFASDANACGKCHRVQGVGQWVGPDLSAIGEKYPKSELFYHVVQPNGAVAFGYQNWHIECTDGRVLNGLIVEETSDKIVLRTAAGDRLAINNSDIEKRRPLPTSLMPEKLGDVMKDQQIADLLEYMATLRQPVTEASEYRISAPLDPVKFADLKRPDAGWRKIVAGKDGVLDLSGLLKSQKEGLGVALGLTLESPVEQSVKIVLNTSLSPILLIDGVVVATTPSKTGGAEVVLPLKAGTYELLIKLPPGVDRPQLTTAFVAKRPVRLTTN